MMCLYYFFYFHSNLFPATVVDTVNARIVMKYEQVVSNKVK